MQRAIDAVNNGPMGYLKAAHTFKVPRSTLFRRANNKNSKITGCGKGFTGFTTVFTSEQENDLCEYLLNMEEMFMGLTPTDVRDIAYQMAIRNNLPNPFSDRNTTAGDDWYLGFMSRHPELSLHTPEATSAARAMAFNKPNVSKFFSLLSKEIDEHHLQPSQIFNVDETGITTVPGHPSKIVGRKGKKRIGSMKSAERGTLVTAEICMSAAGTFVPPMLTFPRIRFKEELMDGAPPGSIAACHPSGWMQTELFTEWFRHFIDFVKPSKDKPALLILDGHASHTKNIDVIDLVRRNHVIMLCLPPHCTHRLQPLDVSFMRPLNLRYDEAIRQWHRNHPGRVVSIYQTARLFGLAYAKAASINIGMSGFKATGICPMNRDIFTDTDYAAAKTTDVAAPPQPTSLSKQANNNEIAGCSYIRPEQLQPYPHCNARSEPSKVNKRRRTGATVVLTSSPYRESLLANKAIAPQPKKIRQTIKPKVTASKSIIETTSSTDEDEEDISTLVDDSSDDDFEHNVGDDDLDNLLQQDKYEVGDFVLVKFAKKRLVTYYIGTIQVIDDDNDEAKTEFMRRSDETHFVWPQKEDISWHDIASIQLKLPKPSTISATSRTLERVAFNCDLNQYGHQLL